MTDPLERRVATALRELFPEPADVALRLPSEQPPRRPRSTWLAIAAAVLVIVAAAGVLALRRHDATAPADQLLACPTHHAADAVPAQPSAGLDANRMLVPNRAPAQAVVCAGDNPRGTVLDNPATLAEQLSWLPRETGPQTYCAAKHAVAGSRYLLGLRFGSALEWVAVSNVTGCNTATNGLFTSSADLGEATVAAYSSGHWPPLPNEQAPCALGYGRRGQEQAMVPGRPTALLVCESAGRSRHRAVTDSAVIADLARRLDAAKSAPTQTILCATPGSAARYPLYLLRFDYAAGPPVVVSINVCGPRTASGSRVGVTPAGVTRELEAYFPKR